MNYISTPNLPNSAVSLFIADAHIENAIVIPPAPLNVLPPGLRRHADLGICVISETKAVCPPDSYDYYKEALSPYGFEIIKGNFSLGCHYPHDSAYNVCIVGKKCFLNYDVCDTALSGILTSEGYEIINVNQGYSKCSICPLDENSIITADVSIFRAAKKAGMDALLISNDTITLKGYSNGFFGGCCGMGAKDVLLVNGDIETFADKNAVFEFLKRKSISIETLKKSPLTDIGSIIPLMTK